MAIATVTAPTEEWGFGVDPLPEPQEIRQFNVFASFQPLIFRPVGLTDCDSPTPLDGLQSFAQYSRVGGGARGCFPGNDEIN